MGNCGGAAVPRALMEKFQERFGVRILQGWGMTETSPLCAVGHPPRGVAQGTTEEMDWRSRTGRVVGGVELRIVDDASGAVLGAGVAGELQVRGWAVMKEYWDFDGAESGRAAAEAVLGAAYRPVDNDRWNTLFKYTYFYNVPTMGQVTVSNLAAEYVQKSHVAAIDATYDLSSRWSIGGKYAYRFGEISLPEGAGDFRLIDRKGVEVLRTLGEKARFSKGLYAWIGFKGTGVPFVVEERRFGDTDVVIEARRNSDGVVVASYRMGDSPRSRDSFTLRVPQLNLLVPLGLSFFIFQSVAYVVDVYRRDAEPAQNFFEYLKGEIVTISSTASSSSSAGNARFAQPSATASMPSICASSRKTAKARRDSQSRGWVNNTRASAMPGATSISARPPRTRRNTQRSVT